MARPEILGPGVGAECCHRNGLHLFEDHFYPEIIDPATGQPLADDQEGELVLTTLDREAMPLIRYRTGEPAAMLAEPCPCGRTMRRIRQSGGQASRMRRSCRASRHFLRKSRRPCGPSRGRCRAIGSC